MSTNENNNKNDDQFNGIKYKIFGKPRDLNDPTIFHKIALIPALAWIGLGGDGLSSSAYGPEEAFKALGQHTYLAIILVIMIMLTIFIISYSYSLIIEHFPSGGGGYIVATYTLGKNAGVISGCALIVDYVLTISVSIASCGDALFSFMPFPFQNWKIIFELFLIIILLILNIRGVKESVSILAPIFAVFILSHILLIGYGITSHLSKLHEITNEISNNFNVGLRTLGLGGMFLLLMRSYSMGAGTFTGIEAVSNGLQVMREPKVKTAKTTMLYMALSLALTAGGVLICYLLLDVKPITGKTLNAVLAENIFGSWRWLVFITIISEGALLFVAAQTGFIDGPRVMANMAIDRWFPTQFSNLSERFTIRNGILLMGFASIALLLLTHGSIVTLVVMYSINVFLTFSLSQIGMCKYYIKNRKREKNWLKLLPITLLGFIICFSILIATSLIKFGEGGWITLIITSMLILLCYKVKNHYNRIKRVVEKLNIDKMDIIPLKKIYNANPINPDEMTAIQLVSDYSGFGIHTFYNIINHFPNLYQNIIFISVAQVDSGSFKGANELKNLEQSCINMLEKYVELARKNGIRAAFYFKTGINITDTAVELCKEASEKYANSTIFTGLLKLKGERFYHKFLHNSFSYTIERKLLDYGITAVILPIVMESGREKN